MNGKASKKDWGVAANSTFQYLSEAEIVRTIESNDGATLVLVEEFRRSRTLDAFSRNDDLQIDLGVRTQTLLDVAGSSAVGLPPGWTVVTVGTVNQLLKVPTVLGAVSRALEDPMARVKIFTDSLEGKKVRITYANGRGVIKLENLAVPLTEDERKLILTSSLASDAYVLPDLGVRPGDPPWEIEARDLVGFVDLTLRATPRGSITVRRGPDGGTADSPTAEVEVVKGIVDLNLDDSTLAQWAPAGSLTFSFKDGIVTGADLRGRFHLKQHSGNHILFDVRFEGEPKYRVTYSCQLVPK